VCLSCVPLEHNARYRRPQVCNVAPLPGETKVWQYITLSRRLYLLDCPGVVYHSTGDSKTDTVLKGVVRIANLDDATEHIGEVLERCKHQHIVRTYGISAWQDVEDFLTQLATSAGKLLKGGQPDLNTAAKMVLQDWQRGKLPFFTTPPQELVDRAEAIERAQADAEEQDAADKDHDPEEAGEKSEAAVPTTPQSRQEVLTIPAQDLHNLPSLPTDANDEEHEGDDGELLVVTDGEGEEDQTEDSEDDDDLTWEYMLGNAIGGKSPGKTAARGLEGKLSSGKTPPSGRPSVQKPKRSGPQEA